MQLKMISVVTPCCNEEDNVVAVYERVKQVFTKLPSYGYEHIFIDNASQDGTIGQLRALAAKDQNVKVILNTRNFGHIRSPFYGILQAQGDAVVLLVADLQDPPELIKAFIQQWEAGYKVVLGVKPKSKENRLMFFVRKCYYYLVSKIADADTRLVKNFTGFGLYDQTVVKVFRMLDDPYPYLRGLIAELGFKYCEISFEQPLRQHGVTKNNFYTLYDLAMLGITSHSKVPLRLATMLGFGLAMISVLIALGFLIAKLLLWQYFALGIAPIVIGLFFFAAIELFFIGLLGEYVLSIHTKIMHRPLVIEAERINFKDKI